MTLTHKQKADKLGRRAEILASLYLRFKGYKILALRAKTPVGEIDIVAQKNAFIIFVEVKARASLEGGFSALDAHKKRRMVRGALYWMNYKPSMNVLNPRFDVIIMRPFRWPYHVQNAFQGA